jgi:hypothetical protein
VDESVPLRQSAYLGPGLASGGSRFGSPHPSVVATENYVMLLKWIEGTRITA